jgi:predicted DNA-binding transcriptional regulator AlpA
MSENCLLSRDDVAQLLKVSSRTVYKIQSVGFAGRPPLRPVISGPRLTRFHPADVENWLRMSPQPTARRGRGRPKKYTSK